MKTASGSNRRNDAWEPHVFVAPRGIREHAWLLMLLTATCGVLLFRGAWIATLAALIVVAVVPALLGVRLACIPAHALVLAGTVWLTVSVIANAQTGRTLVEFAISASWWGQPIMYPSTWMQTAHLALAFAIALLTIGIVLAYDRRAVDREIVDARVWERQTKRRRQVVRSWSCNRDVPEVLP